MKRILVTTDLSARSAWALQRAAMLSQQFSARWQVAHVVDGDQPAELIESASRLARSMLQHEALSHSASGLPEVVVRVGNPADEIVQYAGEIDADIIIMGPHRRDILRDVFIGTTVERVIRMGHHPVLMVNSQPKRSYQKIIAPVDFSETSANALLTAKRLGLLNGVHVAVLHVFETLAKGMMIYANVEREKIEEYVDHEAIKIRRKLEEFVIALGLGELSREMCLEEGQTFSVIKKMLDSRLPDLVIIGTRGLTGAKRLLLGSVADAVLRGAGRDVLAVPPPR